MQESKQEKSPIKQRILLYLGKNGISMYDCYAKTGITRGILGQNNGISEDNLARFLAYYTDVNIEWLVSGHGPMLREPVQPPSEPVSASSDAMAMRLMDKLDKKESQIDQLQSELRAMEKELSVLKALHSQSQDKEPESRSSMDKDLELFSLEPSEASIKGYSPTSPPAISKKLSAGKM